jgi:hypothetical protein
MLKTMDWSSMFLLAENDIFVALVIKIVFMLRHEYSPEGFFLFA